MSRIPIYVAREPEIVVRWSLQGGAAVALQVPLPVDDKESRALLVDLIETLNAALAPFAPSTLEVQR